MLFLVLGAMRRLLVLAALLVAMPAGAAIFTVDSTVDAVDSNPGDGACASAADACTLRAAVMEANALAGEDVVSVPPGNYLLTAGSSRRSAPFSLVLAL